MKLFWTQGQLIDVLSKRVAKVVGSQYTQEAVDWQQVFPPQINKRKTADYIVERTMMRPRDIIHFANCCVQIAVDHSHITEKMLRAAESQYSANRFRSLGDEWGVDYPSILQFAGLLKKRPASFLVSEMSEVELAFQLYDNQIAIDEFRSALVKVFYHVGLIGVKLDPHIPISWAFRNHSVLTPEIQPDTRLLINPMFFRTFGVNLRA